MRAKETPSEHQVQSSSRYPRFLDLPDEQADRATAAAAIVPVPYGATCTWVRGAEPGRAALLAASPALETWDCEHEWEPCAAGIATLPPVGVDGSSEELNTNVESVVAELLTEGKLPVVIGGEHSVSLGAIRAARSAYADLSVLQLDAHADLRREYLGSPYNHACVMARARELCPIVQVGLRAIDRSELDSIDRSRAWFAHEIVGTGTTAWMEDVVSALTDHVYLTIDLDAFDPSLVPATGTPEPGGMSWQEVTRLVDLVARRRKVVGFDVVELCPAPGHHASEFIAAKLVYRVLAAVLPRG
jgi:agmatinase